MTLRDRRTLLPLEHKLYPWIALVAGAIMLARAGSTVGVFNHTTDEPAHIGAAVTTYDAHKVIYMVEHPPLQRLVVGGVLRIAGVNFPDVRGVTEVKNRHEANWVGSQVLFHGKVPYWRVLIIARLTSLIFPAIVLLYVYLLGKYLANSLVAMLATLFCSLDPTILAHGALAGTDVAAAAGFMIGTYHGLRFIGRPTWKNALIGGLALGLALACKFTCLLLVPALGAIVVCRGVARVVKKRRESAEPRAGRPCHAGAVRSFFGVWPGVGKMAGIVVVSFVTLWGTYLFDIGTINDQSMFENEQTWKRIPQRIKDTRIPMPSMVLGQMFLASLSKHGFRCYLNGHISTTGSLLYFPEAIAIKSPLGLVTAVGLASLVFVFSRRRRPWIVLAMLLPPGVLLAVSSAGKLQIGIRHVIPVLPFLYLFAAFMLHRGIKVIALLALMLLAAVETAAIHPDYLSFFNQAVGGPRQGYKYLGDSNIDWGQDTLRLAGYLKAQDRPYRLRLTGAVVDELGKFVGLKAEAFDPAPGDMLWGTVDDTLREAGFDPGVMLHPPAGLFAISNDVMMRTEALAWAFDKKTLRLPPDYSWLKRFPVAKRIGYAITVYDLDRPPVNPNNPATDAAHDLP